MKATTVIKAQKPQGKCSKCGDDIPVGATYLWVKPRYGAKVVRCAKYECRLRQSDLTSNDKLARLYEIQQEIEDFEVDEETTLEDVRSYLDDWSTRAEEVAEEYEESAQNIEDGFGHETSQSAEARENGEEARNWAEALSGLDLPEEWDEEAARKDAAAEIEDASDAADLAEQIDNLVDEKHQDWIENVQTALNDVSSELSL